MLSLSVTISTRADRALPRPTADGQARPTSLPSCQGCPSPLPPHTMQFFAFPVELQSAILSHAPLATLVDCAAVSHHLNELALPQLYATVTLSAWAHLTAFFLPPPILAARALDAYTTRRSAELARVKELCLDFPAEHEDSEVSELGVIFRRDAVFPTTPCNPFGPLPRAIRSSPLQVDSLRLSIWGENGFAILLPILQIVNPTTVHLFAPEAYSKILHGPLASVANKSWSRLLHLEVSARDSSPFGRPKNVGALSRKLGTFKVVFLPDPPTMYYQEVLVEDALAMVAAKDADKIILVAEEEKTETMIEHGGQGAPPVVKGYGQRQQDRGIDQEADHTGDRQRTLQNPLARSSEVECGRQQCRVSA